MKKNNAVFYLRTDIGAQKLQAGGSVTHTIGVIKGFQGLGYKVFCSSSAMTNVLKSMPNLVCKTIANPSFFYVVGHKINCLLSNVFFTIQSALLLRNHKVDFIYQRYSMLNVTGALLSLFYGIPLVLEFNSSERWKEENWHRSRKIPMTGLVGLFEKINVLYAHQIIVVSQPLKEMLVAAGVKAEKILVNPNGVDPEVFDSVSLQDKRNALRKKLGIEDKFVFGFIGTFSSWHGIDALAKMIPAIVQKKRNVHFLLIGEGDLLPWLRQTIYQTVIASNKVTFTGLVPTHEANHYLAACDAFLLPTKPNEDGSPFFGSPTKMFEYMSMAKPVITSDLDQLGELVFPALHVAQLEQEKLRVTEEVGILVEPNNLEELVFAAARLLDFKKDDLQLLGDNARKRVIKSFTWQQHTKKIVTFIQQYDQAN